MQAPRGTPTLAQEQGCAGCVALLFMLAVIVILGGFVLGSLLRIADTIRAL